MSNPLSSSSLTKVLTMIKSTKFIKG